MLWKDPVYKDRNVLDWLSPNYTGFPLPIVKEVIKIGQQPIKQMYLDGLLVEIREGEGERKKIATVMSNLLHHADLAIYLSAWKVLQMITDREDHPSSGLPVLTTLSQADVVVLNGVMALNTQREISMFDGIMADRSCGPSRVTILLLPVEDAPKFLATRASFRGRRIEI